MLQSELCNYFLSHFCVQGDKKGAKRKIKNFFPLNLKFFQDAKYFSNSKRVSNERSRDPLNLYFALLRR